MWPGGNQSVTFCREICITVQWSQANRYLAISQHKLPNKRVGWAGVWMSPVDTSYRADKVKFTDRRADRRTDAGNDNTPSVWKAKGYKIRVDHREGSVFITCRPNCYCQVTVIMRSKKGKKCLGPGPRAPMVATPMYSVSTCILINLTSLRKSRDYVCGKCQNKVLSINREQ